MGHQAQSERPIDKFAAPTPPFRDRTAKGTILANNQQSGTAHFPSKQGYLSYYNLILKSPELELRPIHHRRADRVRAHMLICVLASYVEWHMRRALAPLLCADEQPPDTASSPVAPAPHSAVAQDKASRKLTHDQLPVQSFRDLLRHLATIVKNRIEPRLKSITPFDMITRPDALQQRALQLLQLSPRLLAT